MICCAGLVTNASAVTISGSDLNALYYHPNGGVAQYGPGTPDVAQLYTPDSGVNGGSPAVFVKANNVGFASLGTLTGLTASYTLADSTGGQPYWLTYLYDPSGGYVGVISFGGPTLNSSTQIHVFYDYTANPSIHTDTYWGLTLGQLDGTTYGTTTFGQLGVYETGVEIGNWDNGNAVIPASANISSISLFESVPDGGATLGFLSASLGCIVLAPLALKRKKNAQSAAATA